MTSFAIGTKHAALCADGQNRTATVSNYPDTFFSVPARVKVKGKTVTGFICHVGIGEEKILHFTPNGWRKNAVMLPKWPEKCRKCYGMGTVLPKNWNGIGERVTCSECQGTAQKVYAREVAK